MLDPRADPDAMVRALAATGEQVMDARAEIARLRAALSAAEAQLSDIAATLNLERDDYEGALWFLPAEPGPVECATVADAVRELLVLCCKDARSATARLLAAEAKAERYREALEGIERVAKRNEALIGGGTDSEWLVRVASGALTEGERDD